MHAGHPTAAGGSGTPSRPDGSGQYGRGVRTVTVTGDGLPIIDVVDVARGRARAVLGPDVEKRMAPSRAVVADAVDRGAVVYGVTTGFGALADVSIAHDDLSRMQLALVRS